MGLMVEYWTMLYDFLEGDDFRIASVGSAAVTMGTMVLLNLFFLPVDLLGKPEWIMKYKVQSKNTGPVDSKKVWLTMKTVMFNQTFLSTPVLFVVYMYSPAGWCHPDNIPSIWIILRDCLASFVMNDVTFYYAHRLLHYGPLYKAIHKQHHEWQAPIGLSALYAHPVEYVLGNTIPVMIGPFLMRSHMLTTCIWYFYAMVDTIVTHSGYHLPFVPKSPEFHDFHHLKFNCNYGGGIYRMDWLHGTDRLFMKSVQYKRDGMCWGTPLNVVYPDEKETKNSKSN